MPRIRTIQQRFTQGELDPRMRARVDIDQYYGALDTALNIFPIPQGGFRRRPGLQYINFLQNQVARITSGVTITTPNGGTGANANDGNGATVVTTTNNLSTTNPYVVVQYDLGSAKNIAYVDVVAAFLSAGSSASDFAIQVSTNGSAWTTLRTVSLSTASTGRRTACNGLYRYVRFAKITGTDLGTAKVNLAELWVWEDTGVLSDSRYIDFAFNTDQTYMLVATDQNLAVYRNGILQTHVPIYGFTSAILGSMNWTQSADTLLLFSPNAAPQKVLRISDGDWSATAMSFDYIPRYAFTPVEQNPAATLTPSGTSNNVTITASSGIFVVGFEDQYITGNGGRARIVQYVDSTHVKAVMEIPFFDTTVIASGAWTLEQGYEATWSTTRGWPNCGVFHEGRLWIGGSLSRPSTLWGSRVGLFFDFDPGSILDDDAIEATLDTGQFNKILNMYSGRSLQIFTTGAEHAVLQQLNDPITPSNFNSKRQTSVGSKEGLRVVEVEGSVLYIQRQGDSIQEFIYSDTQQAYVNNIVSLLSSHLIKKPVDFALRKSTSTAEGNYLICVNNDGTLAVSSILRSQNITAITPQTTAGLFKRCGVDDDDIYLTVERVINGQTVRYIERFNFNFTTDCAQQFAGAHTTVSGLGYVEGQMVKVRADDSMLDNETVTGSAITLSRASTTYVEVGLDFPISVRDLPVEVPQIGTAVGLKKNISEVDLQLYQTQNIAVNGKVLSFERFGPAGGGSPLDAPPVSFTGLKRIKGFRGWDFTAQLDITQTQPMPMTVLAIVKKVKV